MRILFSQFHKAQIEKRSNAMQQFSVLNHLTLIHWYIIEVLLHLFDGFLCLFFDKKSPSLI